MICYLFVIRRSTTWTLLIRVSVSNDFFFVALKAH